MTFTSGPDCFFNPPAEDNFPPMFSFASVEELVTSDEFQRQLSMALAHKDRAIDELRAEIIATTLPAAPAPTEGQAFRAHLQWASDEVATWPAWKQRTSVRLEGGDAAAPTEQAGDVQRAPDAQQHHDKAMRDWMTKHGYGHASPGFVMADLQARIERKDAELRALAVRQAPESQDAWPEEPTPEMQAAGAQAIRFDTTTINKMWTANAVYRAMRAAQEKAQ